LDGFGELLMVMNPLRKQIRDIQARSGIGWDIIEQDYVLSCVLFGIANVEKLKSTLVFKGGTALKKCYFQNYRFSQDLDFSVQGEHPSGEELHALLTKACEIAATQTNELDLQCKRYPEKEPHPEAQEAFIIHARLPWQRDPMTTVKVEVTTQESVLLPPRQSPILHEYDEKIDGTIFVYQIEEIIAEKIRAILQFSKKLHERGWGRSRVRDYYDLWRIFHEYGQEIDKSILPDLVRQKCIPKHVSFTAVDDLFTPKLMVFLNEWDQWLSAIVPEVPEKEIVILDLRKQLHEVWK